MNNQIIGIIPLGGNATRMNFLPKFLLPCKIGFTLLDNIIDIFYKNNITNIIAGVSVTNNLLLEKNIKIQKNVTVTKTMSETVFNLINSLSLDEYKIILIMPDTYIKINTELNIMIDMLNIYQIVVIVWKIKEYQIGKVGQCKIENGEIVDVIDKDPTCDYPYFWGIIGWDNSINKYIDPEWETIGNLIHKSLELNIKIGTIICDGDYYDCGTYSEYFQMIKCET